MNISRIKAVLSPLAFILVVVVSPWVLIGVAIPYQAQDFPVIDDWAYFRGACSFFHNYEPDYQYWASPVQLGQWLWAMPFLAVLGESLAAAKVSTLVLSWLGLWAFYILLRRQADVSPRLAAFATACLAWNPFFFLLSGTFMTDVPALSFSLIALAFYTHALDSGRLVSLAAAVLVALMAVATRQNSIAVPGTAGILLLRSRYRTNPLWLAAVAAPLALFFVLSAWLRQRPDASTLDIEVPGFLDLCWLAFTAILYLGLLTAPLLLLLPPTRLGKVFWVALAAMLAGVLWLFLLWQSFLVSAPLSDKDIIPYLNGVFMEKGAYLGGVQFAEPHFGWPLRLLLTVLGCICAAMLIVRVAEQRWRWAERPLVIFSLLHLAPIVVAPVYFDRYLLALVPGVLALAIGEYRQPRWKAGFAALVLFGGLSLCLTHDWLAKHAACWNLGRRAVAIHGIEPNDIVGTWEWDQWHREWSSWYVRHYQLAPSPKTVERAFGAFHRSHLGHYRLTLSRSRQREGPNQVIDYQVIDIEPFTQWFPPRKGGVYLIRRPPDEIDAAERFNAKWQGPVRK